MTSRGIQLLQGANFRSIIGSMNRQRTTKPAPNSSSEVAIFGRLIQDQKGDLSRDLARYVLTLGFSSVDQTRMTELAASNQEASLTQAEQEELKNYIRASHLLALLHSKARKSLKRRRAS
jgi:hypothetical protein